MGARFTLLPLGYKQGAKLVTEFADRLNALTDAAILLGVTVVGALIPTVIKATVPFVYKSGKVELKMQDMLDQIMPSLVPVLLVALIYALLGHKKIDIYEGYFISNGYCDYFIQPKNSRLKYKKLEE